MESEKIMPPKITMPVRHEIGLEQTSQEFPEAGRRIYIVINHASRFDHPAAAWPPIQLRAESEFARRRKTSLTEAV